MLEWSEMELAYKNKEKANITCHSRNTINFKMPIFHV